MIKKILILICVVFSLTLTAHAASDAVIIDLGVNNPVGPTSTPTSTPNPNPGPGNPGGPTGGGGGTGMYFLLTNLQIRTNTTQAFITWDTNMYSQDTLSWGQSLDYELGSLSEGSLTTRHSISLENLKPGTRYYFKIISRTASGGVFELSGQTFVTQSTYDITPPGNATHFSAVPKTSTIDLFWNVPRDSDFVGVKIVRSPQFYPRDPYEGKVIYDGIGVYIEDKEVELNKRYYYTLFSYDKNGNFSSGTLADAVIGKTSATTTPVPIPDPRYENLDDQDFIFSQGDRVLRFVKDVLYIDGGLPMLVVLPHEKVPDVKKTIIFELYDPRDNRVVYSFLIRPRDKGEDYQGTFFPDEFSGEYPFSLRIFDAQNRLTKEIKKTIFIQNDAPKTTFIANNFFVCTKVYSILIIWLIIMLFLTLVLWISHRKRMI